MPDQQVVKLRDRILGILIRNAREHSHASFEDCATVLGVSEAKYKTYEEGEEAISLPEMELLGRYLRVPLHELRNDDAQDGTFDVRMPDPETYCSLRDRIIGVRLRQARLEADYTQEEIGAMIDHASSTISAYEYGKSSIALSELEFLSQKLGVPMREFFNADGGVGQWHVLQKQFEQFTDLPEEMREFVLRPINRSYLELAMKLAAMPAGALRQIAEGLLEITY